MPTHKHPQAPFKGYYSADQYMSYNSIKTIYSTTRSLLVTITNLSVVHVESSPNNLRTHSDNLTLNVLKFSIVLMSLGSLFQSWAPDN